MSHAAQIRDRNAWVIRLRFIVIAVLTGNYLLNVPLDTIIWYRTGFAVAVAVVVLAANIIWTILLKRHSMPVETLGYYQCIFDLLAVSLVVYQHGASGSAGYLYVFVILIAGVLLQRRGIILIAFSSVVLYMAFLLLETSGKIEPLPPMSGEGGLLPPQVQFLIDISIKGFFFFLIALACVNMQDLLTKMTKESEFLADFNKSIINMIPVGVVVFDASKSVVVFNPAMERITLANAEKSMGRSIGDVFPGIDESWRAAIDKVESTGEEVRLLGALLPLVGGKTVRVNAKLQPLTINDQVLATVCTIQAASR